MEISSKHLFSKTVRARELKFWESHVTCHMSCVTCHLSLVTFHMSHVTFHMSCAHNFSFLFLDKVVKLVVGRSVINGPATPSTFNFANLKCQRRLHNKKIDSLNFFRTNSPVAVKHKNNYHDKVADSKLCITFETWVYSECSLWNVLF